MQINVSGGKSGQVTEDYILSGMCIFPPPFLALLCVHDRISVWLFEYRVIVRAHSFLRASLNK